MDRLNRARELTPRQLQLVENIDPDGLLADQYRFLYRVSSQLWQLAFEKQDSLNQGFFAGPFTTNELGRELIKCADLWSSFKRLLEE